MSKLAFACALICDAALSTIESRLTMQLMILLCPGSLHASKMVLVCGVVLYMNALPVIDLGAEAAALAAPLKRLLVIEGVSTISMLPVLQGDKVRFSSGRLRTPSYPVRT